MLQIITGKFFNSDERHVSERKGVLYSNFRWHLPMETNVGVFEPLDTHSAQTTYLFTYKNQIEKEKGNFSIVRTGDGEIIEQFRLLCVFGFRACFAEDRSWISHLCRSGAAGQGQSCVPAQLLSRYFSQRIEGDMKEGQAFAVLVEKTLALPRADYCAVITALQTFSGSLDVVGTNLDLAYSMLVYALESLAKQYGAYAPDWNDYHQQTRIGLESVFSEQALELKAVDAIKSALLESAHLKLRGRFLDFVCAHTQDSYFTTEAAGVDCALQRDELRQAARNAYDVRSSYVHQLTPLLNHMRIPQMAVRDVIRLESQPHLTFAGLVRLTHHIISTLLHRLPSCAKEEFKWRSALPGIIQMKMAPQYWTHQASGFVPERAKEYFAGFLSHYLETALRGEAIADMSPVMERIEQLTGKSKPEHRRSMLSLYLLYNACLRPDFRRPKWEGFLESHQSLVDEPCIEMMAARILLDSKFVWTASEGKAALKMHDEGRFQRTALHLPRPIEVALTVAVANQSLNEGSTTDFEQQMDAALLNSAGNPTLQEAIIKARSSGHALEINIVLPRKKPEIQPESSQS